MIAPLGNCLVLARKQVISIRGYFTYPSCIWTRKCTSLLKLVSKLHIQVAHALITVVCNLRMLCVQFAHPWSTWAHCTLLVYYKQQHVHFNSKQLIQLQLEWDDKWWWYEWLVCSSVLIQVIHEQASMDGVKVLAGLHVTRRAGYIYTKTFTTNIWNLPFSHVGSNIHCGVLWRGWLFEGSPSMLATILSWIFQCTSYQGSLWNW